MVGVVDEVDVPVSFVLVVVVVALSVTNDLEDVDNVGADVVVAAAVVELVVVDDDDDGDECQLYGSL